MGNSELSKTVRTFDARTWAKSFNETLVALGYHPHDEGWLICWFANSIMCGYDEASRHAERIQLLPLNELEVIKLIIKVRNDYDNLTNFEKVRLPVDCDGARLYAEAICKTFGTPKVEWPERKTRHHKLTQKSEGYNQGWNDCLDACSRAYEEAGGKK